LHWIRETCRTSTRFQRKYWETPQPARSEEGFEMTIARNSIDERHSDGKMAGDGGDFSMAREYNVSNGKYRIVWLIP
jgi:hypothetical protein